MFLNTVFNSLGYGLLVFIGILKLFVTIVTLKRFVIDLKLMYKHIDFSR